MTIGGAIDNFITHQSVKGYRSKSTIYNYSRYLKDLLEFTGDIPLDEMTLEMIDNWHFSLLEDGSKSPKTASYYLISLRSLLRWLITRGHKPPILPEQIEIPKFRRKIKDIPTVDEIKKLLVSANPNKNSELRDRAILEVLVSSGIRVAELTHLKRSDVNFKERTLNIQNGKGDKQRLAFFSKEAGKYLARYLQSRDDSSDILFYQKRKQTEDKPITSRSIQRVLKKYCKKAGIDSYSPHQLRHFYATYLLKNNANLYEVSRLLGHESIQTTQVYLHATNNELKKAHSKAFGYAEPLTKRHRTETRTKKHQNFGEVVSLQTG